MPQPILSILIPSVTDRVEKFNRLLERLSGQVTDEVEILSIVDNRRLPLGVKRNDMMRLAQGDYVCHIDDDDLLDDKFVETLLPELRHGVDLVAYDAIATIEGKSFKVLTSLDHDNEQVQGDAQNGFQDVRRKPWHWCAWKWEIAIQGRFPMEFYGEDWVWLSQVIPLVKTHRKIDIPLYHYEK